MSASHVAPDGSPLDAYLAMPAGEAPTIIHDAIGDGADVLELGCGVGRLTRVLRAYGHEVVAVDNDAAMLGHVTGAETICADVYALDLGRRFGSVVAASHLVNRPNPADRARLLAACSRHVRDGGVVLVERYPPTWAANPADTSGAAGPVMVTVRIDDQTPDGFAATAEYRLGARTWRQRFTAVHVDDEELAATAHQAGLEFAGWLDPGRTWARLNAPAS